MVVIIALLHCLPPILGALIGGREGLATGTIIGVICAFVFGALVFTIPDLLGVGLGFVFRQGSFKTKAPKIGAFCLSNGP